MKNRIMLPRKDYILDLERPKFTDPNLVVTVEPSVPGNPRLGIIRVQWITPGLLFYIERFGIVHAWRHSFDLGLVPQDN